MVEIRVLGPLEVLAEGRPVALPAGRARIVLAVLALHAGRTVSVGRLIEAAWGEDSPATARAQVQALVSALRRALAAADPRSQAIETHNGGYALRADGVRTDLASFTGRIRRGRAVAAAGRHAEAVGLFRAALALWRGPAFDGFSSRLLEAEAAQYEEIRLAVLEECIGAELDLGLPTPHMDLMTELRAITVAHPLRESAQRLRMIALHRAGRPAEALTAFHEARRALADELGVEPGPALRALYQQILTEDPGLAPEGADRPRQAGSLASRCTLFGRDRDITGLVGLVLERRMVTLVGPPGVGKTQLALAGAAKAAGRLSDGVYVVELDAVTGPELVPSAVAGALGIPAGPGRPVMDALCGALAPRHALLVLDNCEHLLDACAELADLLLTRCPRLHILATSREALALPDEVIQPVGPLDVPPEDTMEAVLRSPAGQMFLDRVAARRPGFAVTDEAQAELVARICRAAEGLPLAVELVAAQLRTYALAEVAARLPRQLRSLSRRRSTPDRHRSLEAAIAWSHRLLSPGEQRVFARLSAFSGGFTLAAAQAVVVDVPAATVQPHRPPHAAAVDTTVRDLVDRSLLQASPEDEPTRYRLLEPIREFAREQLALHDEGPAIRSRHAAYFREMAEHVQLSDDAPGEGRDGAEHRSIRLRRSLRRELPNLRAGLDWSFGPGDLDDGVRLVGAMSWIWVGLPGEGLQWVERALTRLDSAPPTVRPQVLYAAGLIHLSTDLTRAAALLEQAARSAEACGDVPRQLEALAQLSVVRCMQGDAEESARTAELVLTIVQPLATEFATARARVAVAIARCGLGDLSVAAHHLELAEGVLAAHEDREALATVRWAQAELAYYRGDPHSAAALSAAALRDTAVGHDLFATVCRRAQHARNLQAAGDLATSARLLRTVLRACLDKGLWMPAVDALITAARQEADRGHPTRAVTLLSAANTLRTTTGRHPAPVEHPVLRALVRRLQKRLATGEHSEAEKHGSAMTAEQAIRHALESLSPAESGPPQPLA
ncbi:BTAD domain-containing putative transcriptional regulator [Streptomyces triculaminicus]|uniref:BTAD domain-containing putative transcriptional regulator n=1 Tax=Streptomyces triculaminicus TaxID=2816232 RepID=UPI0037D0E6E4